MVNNITWKNRRIALCVAGWHFGKEFYAQLGKLSEFDIFIVSHKSPHSIPSYIKRYVKPNRILFEPNLGYDWGCYQQFIAKRNQLGYQFDIIFFMHDDLIIHNQNFISKTVELLGEGAIIVGNGRNSLYKAWPKTHLFCYAHSVWIPPSLDFEHETVRGSFFATTAEALREIQSFEIFWDPRRLSLRFGNHSLIATCGKFQQIFGSKCFGFLGESYLTTPYLTEIERGGQGVVSTLTLFQKMTIELYHRLGRLYVLLRIKYSQGYYVNTKVIQILGQILSLINGVPPLNIQASQVSKGYRV